jgi:hypothetical protein
MKITLNNTPVGHPLLDAHFISSTHTQKHCEVLRQAVWNDAAEAIGSRGKAFCMLGEG